MSVRLYSRSDYQSLCDWYASWGLVAPEEEFLPTVGALCPDTGACFLYKTDSAGAIIEGLIVNKDTGRATREKAVSAILDFLFREAKALGFKTVAGYTKIDKVRGDAHNKHNCDIMAHKYVLIKRKL